MAEAWQDPAAWEGMTAAGGVDLRGEVAGVVALDELVIHGWDLAKAIGRPAGYVGPGLEAVHGIVQQLRGAEASSAHRWRSRTTPPCSTRSSASPGATRAGNRGAERLVAAGVPDDGQS